MSELDILNCGKSGALAPSVLFEFVCPMTWEKMEETDSPKQRWCQHCERRVYQCNGAVEAGLRAEQGECIAVPDWFVKGLRREPQGRIIVGTPQYQKRFQKIIDEYQASQQKP